MIPSVVTHNYDPTRGICRNICHLPNPEAERILDEIRASGGRRLKPSYLKRRHAAEDWLMAERSQKLGKTYLDRPVYFFLGDFFANDGKDPSRPKSLVMPLAEFRPEALTFTYHDSMTSRSISVQAEHQFNPAAYHSSVLTLSEIKAVVATFGPSDDFIEVQVWDDRPIKDWLADQPAPRPT